jgi:putative ABC transport system permease protein
MYRQVQAFFAVQDTMVEFIFALLIFFGLMNTIGASIFERTGEIGTLRALGDTESDVLKIFLCEIFFQALLGLLIFVPITFFVIQLVNAVSFPITMPLATEPMPLRLEPQWYHFLRSGFIVLMAALIAGWIPARRGSKISIVEALRKNIN